MSGQHHLSPTPNSVEGKPITLIGGMNGGGKTTILDAILLLLYGQRCPSYKESGISYSNYLEACMHRSRDFSSNQSWIELKIKAFLDNKESSLLIRRSWEKGNVRIKESLQVWKEDVLDSYLALNWDTYVEDLLPYGIANLIFFDGEKIAKLASENDNSETTRKSIQSLLGLDIVDRLIVDMKKVINKHEKLIPSIEEDLDLNNLKTAIQERQLQLQSINQEITSTKTSLLKLNHKLEQKEDQFLKTGGELAQTRSTLISTKAKLESSLAENKEKMISLAASNLPVSMLTPLLNSLLDNMKTEKLRKDSASILPILKQHDASIVSALKEFNATDELQNNLVSYLDNLRKTYEANTTIKSQFPSSEKNIELVVRFLGGESQQLCFTAKTLVNNTESLELQLEQADRHLLLEVDESKSNLILKELKSLSQKIGEVKESLVRLEQNYQQKEIEINRMTMQYRKNLETILEVSNDAEESKRIIEYSIRTQKKMEEYKKVLKLKKLSDLSLHITEAFLFLIHKTSLVSKVIVDNDALEVKLFDMEGIELPKSRLSAGEKQMLAISILWGLAKSSGRQLPVIIDTPMGRLDSSHRLNFVEKYLPNASHQVIILSTDTEIQGQYLSSIKKHINNSYMLMFDHNEQTTKITKGYFDGEAI
ncbi:DNA sulfur modification protein DndD [Cohnella faecalis]|uniref:Nuclease SbcCD subunit C n=1 Tax=Cohnella faecalis TaxID=2315694 RepID=A0A398CQ13_9BACL|nr:DNA sulfur modification protein DndD [Cohnella faecalis]RIE01531.1 DNA sulfur modification protein DndD [Cohnella faecalis]